MLKLLLSNPWVILGLVVAVLASYGAVGYKAYGMGHDRAIAQQLRDDTIEERTRAAAIAAASAEIAKLEPKNVYRTDRIIRETVEKPVYRDCTHDDATFGLLNQSLTPPDRRTDVDNGGVPGTDPAGR